MTAFSSLNCSSSAQLVKVNYDFQTSIVKSFCMLHCTKQNGRLVLIDHEFMTTLDARANSVAIFHLGKKLSVTVKNSYEEMGTAFKAWFGAWSIADSCPQFIRSSFVKIRKPTEMRSLLLTSSTPYKLASTGLKLPVQQDREFWDEH